MRTKSRVDSAACLKTGPRWERCAVELFLFFVSVALTHLPRHHHRLPLHSHPSRPTRRKTFGPFRVCRNGFVSSCPNCCSDFVRSPRPTLPLLGPVSLIC